MTATAPAAPDLTEFILTDYPRVISTIRGITGSRDSATDAVHDALVQLLTDAEHAWPRNVAAWITVVASNRARDIHRRDAVARRVAEKLRPTTPADPVAVSILSLDLRAALETLPPRMRQVCELHYLRDRSVDQIAAALGIGAGTVKTQLHRGRIALARNLEA
ncbi:MAG TPA: sigma-70 family RNA polymerase sigma factor [Galbitalea sp.]|jgi:RNA polymerase sigma-70 factor (ECF subfamily)|nr:sigma-70 family RNA polymerase sigma factor [Galbitalea sp.]